MVGLPLIFFQKGSHSLASFRDLSERDFSVSISVHLLLISSLSCLHLYVCMCHVLRALLLCFGEDFFLTLPESALRQE